MSTKRPFLIWLYQRAGWRTWYVAAMCYGKLRESLGLPPRPYRFTFLVDGEPVIEFAVKFDRRRWRLVFTEAEEVGDVRHN